MIPTSLSLLLYGVAWCLLLQRLFSQKSLALPLNQAFIGLALAVNAWGIYSQIRTPEGYSFGFFQVAPLFFWAANLLIWASSFQKPLQSLWLFTLPLGIVVGVASLLYTANTASPLQLSPGIFSHVLLSLTAYSLMMAALFQALLLAYQNKQLRTKHPGGWLRLLPPLQTMEALLFELLWAGEILLTLAIISGALFVEDMLAQHLSHKTVYSILAWITYAVLLWGRHTKGWRGAVAMRWTLTGFAFLLLAYFGSKLVLELILQKSLA
jgi:ABC-type uncharacterized transport system permease subunit